MDIPRNGRALAGEHRNDGGGCVCSDGHGGQNNNPAASRMAGKCVARETLGLSKRSTSADVFRKIVWGNVHTLLRIPA